jgi:hypothetical protein
MYGIIRNVINAAKYYKVYEPKNRIKISLVLS